VGTTVIIAISSIISFYAVILLLDIFRVFINKKVKVKKNKKKSNLKKKKMNKK
jgi:hypothetical protein